MISSGNGNSHKHPHNGALKRLDQALVYRIIQTSWGTTESRMPRNIREIQAIYQSDIIINSDGSDFIISTSRKFKTNENPRRN